MWLILTSDATVTFFNDKNIENKISTPNHNRKNTEWIIYFLIWRSGDRASW